MEKIIKLEVDENTKEPSGNAFYATDLLQKIAAMTTDPEVQRLILASTSVTPLSSPSNPSDFESSSLIIKELKENYEQ